MRLEMLACPGGYEGRHGIGLARCIATRCESESAGGAAAAISGAAAVGWARNCPSGGGSSWKRSDICIAPPHANCGQTSSARRAYAASTSCRRTPWPTVGVGTMPGGTKTAGGRRAGLGIRGSTCRSYGGGADGAGAAVHSCTTRAWCDGRPRCTVGGGVQKRESRRQRVHGSSREHLTFAVRQAAQGRCSSGRASLLSQSISCATPSIASSHFMATSALSRGCSASVLLSLFSSSLDLSSEFDAAVRRGVGSDSHMSTRFSCRSSDDTACSINEPVWCAISASVRRVVEVTLGCDGSISAAAARSHVLGVESEGGARFSRVSNCCVVAGTS
mmetsp:Transcript_31848/g.79325  ORF Transcript_31848/g.79325 Transcript_31848/m.79325 type:complete len:332 (-) Transcript_31848:264-1259(-)